jgi:hypothetical protein
MGCCDHCVDAEGFFGRSMARRELRRYRRKGPEAVTRHLVRLIALEDSRGETLLDVGGGIGAIQHELFERGIDRAVHVDASRAYLNASREEAGRLGHAERVDYHFGDFVELADRLPEADVVTLDRVVCCYPDMPRLIRASASKARRLYGLSFPRHRFGSRAAMAVGNLYFRLRGSAFRTYLHPPEAIDAEIQRYGLRPVAEVKTVVWQVRLYRRG